MSISMTSSIQVMEYEDLNREIKRTMRRSARDAVQLGFMLRKMMEGKMWEAAFDCFDTYLDKELHMDYSMANRFMNINRKYSVSGNSMDISTEYEEYSQGLLIEMLSMPPELEAKVTPDMTVKQVREIKKRAKAEKEASVQPETEKEEVVIDGEYREIGEPEPEKGDIATSQSGSDGSMHDASWFTRQYVEIMPNKAAELFGICCKEQNNSDRAKAIQKHIAPYGYSATGCSEYDFTFRGFAAGMDFEVGGEKIHLKYGRFAAELMKILDAKEQKEDVAEDVPEKKADAPYVLKKCITGWSRYGACACCGHDGVQCCSQCEESCNGRCGWINEPYSPKDENEEEVQPLSENDLTTVKYILEKEKKTLDDFLEVGGLPEMTVLKQKIIVAALAGMVCDLEDIVSASDLEQESEQQPELPVLKNNDQRKEWLGNYKEWGLWYRDENIDVNYYKYDFSDGSRLVAAEYPQRYGYWNDKRSDEHYFHLLEKNKKSYKKTYDEQYRNSVDAETYLVDFLKKLQKKG